MTKATDGEGGRPHPHPSIKATFPRRTLTLATSKYRLCPLVLGRFRIPLIDRFVIKYGRNGLAEAHTIQFVAETTSIPVPKIYCAFERQGDSYIVMKRVPGKILRYHWDDHTPQARARILAQLKGMVMEMRALVPPPGTGVSDVLGGSIRGRFHRYLRLGHGGGEPDLPQFDELVAMHKSNDWPLCFTHADLSSLNIMVKGKDVSGIIDWETAGWLPSYWEYTMTWNVNVYNVFWRQHVDEFLEPRPKELEMELYRNNLRGDPCQFVGNERYEFFLNGS